LRLQVFRARVFDEQLRELAHKIHQAAEDSVWASSPDKAKGLVPRIKGEYERFNDLAANRLSDLY
jgi:hypothetical protein